MAPTCSVPEADQAAGSGRIEGDPVDADDTDGVLRQCGEIAGYDFTGWRVLSAMEALGGVEAILLSRNEHMASCTIESPDDVYTEPSAGISDQSEAEVALEAQDAASRGTLAPFCVSLEPFEPEDSLAMESYEGDAVYEGFGRLWRHDGTPAASVAELRFELPDGSVVTQGVVEGMWAVRFGYEMPAGGPIPVSMLDADGNVVAQRNAMDGNCYDD